LRLMWTLFEHVLRDGHRRKDVGPADIEGRLRLRQAVIPLSFGLQY
jgi:hypothetical protein